ncbi:hypothetical protein FKW77_006268 [Venturia effusa]|uniref:Major facilitator superfamily (MFS) profile domain-containing protein n=1 Tax=Venturia effusa TaxID=50376 RepID=A0A517KZK9_9PEZI|nr:hypothetical protein FKW77_006268 [Venturia effusa]
MSSTAVQPHDEDEKTTDQVKSPEDEADKSAPDGYKDLNEVAGPPPNQNHEEQQWTHRESLEERRSQRLRNEKGYALGNQKSKHMLTQLYTISYLILFAIFGTLARLGVQWITNYPNAPVIISGLWANVGGSVIMGFLQQDRAIFEPIRGPHLLYALEDPEKFSGEAEKRPLPQKEDLKRKKTLPLYIGLSVGFCGSFTSFSSFIRDAFLALSNDLSGKNVGHLSRNAGWSVCAVLAVLILEIGLSLTALSFGAHIAIATTPTLARIPKLHTHRFLDPLAVFLGLGCWLGAILLAIWPPRNKWRGEVVFALVFAPLGCLIRFYLSLKLNSKIAKFPLGTFAANVLGTIVLGMCYDLQHAGAGVADIVGCQVLQGIQDGFCGCLTTVSTWVAELKALRKHHAYSYGCTSVAALKVAHGGVDHGIDVAAILEERNHNPTQPTEREDKETRRIIRKIDIRLLPVLAVIYSFALIDRVNLPNARIAGMDEDLGMSIGNRYSLVSMIFFVPYTIFQFPANIAIRKLGAAVWLSFLVVLWGCVSIGMGFTKEWTQLLGCRVILGVLEAGYYPGCIFLLSCWYCRFEVQKRFSAFYLLALLASGFSSILAYGIMQMKGVGGLNGWRWIFIIEGIVTVALGILGFIAIIDFPDKAAKPGLIVRKPFLTIDEAAIILARVDRDRGDAVVDELTARVILHHLKDWKIWEYAWLYFLNNIVTYSFAYFLPIILRSGMGYSVAMSQVLSFPPYVLAAIWMFTTAYIADRTHKRGLVIIFNCLWALIGVAMMAFLARPRDRYAGVFLGIAGINSNIPTLLSYMHNNIVGQSKRALASALLIGGGACGGITASNIFRQQDAPDYIPALVVVICTQGLSVLHVLKNFYVYSRSNKRADRGEIVIEGQEGFRHTL